jgi:hypothetical protein
VTAYASYSALRALTRSVMILLAMLSASGGAVLALAGSSNIVCTFESTFAISVAASIFKPFKNLSACGGNGAKHVTSGCVWGIRNKPRPYPTNSVQRRVITEAKCFQHTSF